MSAQPPSRHRGGAATASARQSKAAPGSGDAGEALGAGADVAMVNVGPPTSPTANAPSSPREDPSTGHGRPGWPRLTGSEVAATVSAGCLCGLIAVLRAISFAGLIYPSRVLQSGVQLYCLATVVAQCAYAFVPGGLHVPVATASSAALPFLVQYAAAIAAGIPGGEEAADRDELGSSVCVGVALASLLSALVFVIVGRVRVGVLFRYIQAPVLYGFFAAIGWSMMLGTVNLVVRQDGKETTFFVSVLAHTEWTGTGIAQLSVALALGATLRFGSRTKRGSHPAFVPAVLTVFLSAFAIVAVAAGETKESLRASNWLFGDESPGGSGNGGADDGGGVLAFVHDLRLDNVQWRAVVDALPNVVAMQAMLALDLAMSVPSLARSLRTTFDVETEFRVAGWSCFVAGILGGPVTYMGLSASKLNGDATPVMTRATGLVAATISLLVFLAGDAVLELAPRVLVGGVTVYLGLGFLLDGLWDSRRHMSKSECLNVAIIVTVSVFTSMLSALAVGFAYCCVLFAWRSASKSRDDFVKYVLPLLWLAPSRPRTPQVTRAVTTRPGRCVVLGLRGYLSFGAVPVLEDMISMLFDEGVGGDDDTDDADDDGVRDAEGGSGATRASRRSSSARGGRAGDDDTVALSPSSSRDGGGGGGGGTYDTDNLDGDEAGVTLLPHDERVRTRLDATMTVAQVEAGGARMPIMVPTSHHHAHHHHGRRRTSAAAGSGGGSGRQRSASQSGGDSGAHRGRTNSAIALSATVARSGPEVADRSRSASTAASPDDLEILVFDMASVIGIDSSASLFLHSLHKQLDSLGVTVVISGASKRVLRRLRAVGFVKDSDTVLSTLDVALQTSEDMLITGHRHRASLLAAVGPPTGKDGGGPRASAAGTATAHLTAAMTATQVVVSALPLLQSLTSRVEQEVVERIAGQFVTVEFAAGKRVYRQGDEADALFVVRTGTVSLRRPAQAALAKSAGNAGPVVVGSDGVVVPDATSDARSGKGGRGRTRGAGAGAPAAAAAARAAAGEESGGTSHAHAEVRGVGALVGAIDFFAGEPRTDSATAGDGGATLLVLRRSALRTMQRAHASTSLLLLDAVTAVMARDVRRRLARVG